MTSPHPAPALDREPELVDDFDAFWQQHTATQPHVRILGEIVPVPVDVPLRVQQQIETGGEQTLTQLTTMVGELFGADTCAAWIAKGAGAMQLSVILAWAMLRVQGQAVTFAEALEQAKTMAAEQQRADAERKARHDRIAQGADEQTRAALAAHEQAVIDAGKALYGGSGPLSSPTSAASTASAATSWHA